MIGQMFGPFEIIEKLGEGGMGDVYEARDTRLDRSVVIKVLPPTSAPTRSAGRGSSSRRRPAPA